MIALIVATAVNLQAIRSCSDGQPPRDTLRGRPIYFKFEPSGKLTISMTTNGPGGGECKTVQRGSFVFDDLILRTKIENVESCGDCPVRWAPDNSESAMRFTPIGKRLRFEFSSEFGRGGSCQPGQHLWMDLVPAVPPSEAMFCDSAPSS